MQRRFSGAILTSRRACASTASTFLSTPSHMRRLLPLIALLVSAACAGSPAVGGMPAVVVVPPSAPRELLPDQQVQQVLNRLAFGPRPGDAERVRALGVDR